MVQDSGKELLPADDNNYTHLPVGRISIFKNFYFLLPAISLFLYYYMILLHIASTVKSRSAQVSSIENSFCFQFLFGFFFFFCPCPVSLQRSLSNVKGSFCQVTKLKGLSCLWEENILFCFSEYTEAGMEYLIRPFVQKMRVAQASVLLHICGKLKPARQQG